MTALSPVLRLRTNPPTESTVWVKSWGEGRTRASERGGEQERSCEGEKVGRGSGGPEGGASTASQGSRRTGLDFCANQSCPPVGKEHGGDDEDQGVW